MRDARRLNLVSLNIGLITYRGPFVAEITSPNPTLPDPVFTSASQIPYDLRLLHAIGLLLNELEEA